MASANQSPLELILYSRPDCYLCDRLERLIEPHLDRLRQDASVTLTKRCVTDDPGWQERYGLRIPVLTCGQRVLVEGRPEPDQVARALTWVLI